MMKPEPDFTLSLFKDSVKHILLFPLPIGYKAIGVFSLMDLTPLAMGLTARARSPRKLGLTAFAPLPIGLTAEARSPLQLGLTIPLPSTYGSHSFAPSPIFPDLNYFTYRSVSQFHCLNYLPYFFLNSK